MPSARHQVVAELFRLDPELVRNAELQQLFTPALPALPSPAVATVAAEPIDFSAFRPKGGPIKQADKVLVCRDRKEASQEKQSGDKAPAIRLLVVEVQTRHGPKRESWHYYCVLAQATEGCPADLLVIALDDRIGKWAGRPYTYGGLTLRPRVLIPSRVRYIVDAEEALAKPAMTILAIAMRGIAPDDARAAALLAAGDRAASRLQSPLIIMYLKSLLSRLPASTYQEFRAMADMYQSPIIKSILAEGIEQGIQHGVEQGLQQGIEQGMRKLAHVQLAWWFKDQFTADLQERLAQADIDEVLQIMHTMMRPSDVSLEEVFGHVPIRRPVPAQNEPTPAPADAHQTNAVNVHTNGSARTKRGRRKSSATRLSSRARKA